MREISTRSTSPASRRLRKVIPPPKSQMGLPDLRLSSETVCARSEEMMSMPGCWAGLRVVAAT